MVIIMKRTIFLVDMDAFFISCELTRHPEIINKPAAVAGDPSKRSGIILTANYEARKYGIYTTMLINQALKLCPGITLFPPDHKFYKKISDTVFEILSIYTPLIQKNSIDEAWLDMTGCYGTSKHSIDIARQILNDIRANLNLSCSIGISENKFLSKMASDMKKPAGITQLWKNDIEKILWPLPVTRMYGIGNRTAQKFMNFKINTIGDLANFNTNILIKKFGKLGSDLYNLANGIDNSPISPYSASDIKSIGKSTTLSEDTSDIEYAKKILLALADKVASLARKYNKKGSKIQITLKYYNFQTITRQTTISSTYLTHDIYYSGVKLLEKVWNTQIPVRLIGIALSGFKKNDQISMFDILERQNENNISNRYEKIESTIDNLRRKYGSSIINRAIFLEKNSSIKK